MKIKQSSIFLKQRDRILKLCFRKLKQSSTKLKQRDRKRKIKLDYRET